MMNKIDYIGKNIELSTTNSGYTFAITDPVWVLDKNIKLNITLILDKLNIEHHYSFLITLSIFATTRSSSYTKKMFWAFYDFVKTTKHGLITDMAVIKYHEDALKNKIDHLDSMRVFFKKWHNLEYPGVTEQQIKILYKGKIKRRKLGEMVNTMDLDKGPLLDSDIINFNEDALLLFERDIITTAELTMALITSFTGRRPIQTSHLKLKDILYLYGGKNEIALNFPRAKHGGDFRSEFSKLKIIEDLNDIIIKLHEQNTVSVMNILGREITEEEQREIPLFLDIHALREVKNDRGLSKILKTDFLHIKANAITTTIQKIAKNIDSLQHAEVINARRFRYALGTRAAQEGYGIAVIAELLDHRTLKNVGCYVRNLPEHCNNIDEVMTKSMLNYARAFKGEVINSDTGSIKIKSHKGVESGNCANCNDCQAAVPIPCYTCPHFQPWINAPHKEIYDFLIEERKRIANVTNDMKIAMALDRTIIAISEVIDKCDTLKRRSGNGDN